MKDWFRVFHVPRPAGEDAGKNVVLTGPSTMVPSAFTVALAARLDPMVVVPIGIPGGCPAQASHAVRYLTSLRPKRIVVLGGLPLAGDFLRAVGVPVSWISAERPDAALSGAGLITVRGERLQKLLPQAQVTGDPLLGIDVPLLTSDDELCLKFREIRERGRWIIYFAATEDREETLAYTVFLQLSRRGVGLLALAPRDPVRREPVYREAMRFHLLTNRHGRLVTSYVPHQTRVYYIEDEQAAVAMHRCADVVVAGGTLETVGPKPEVVAPLALGRPVVVGAVGHTPLIAAAVTDGAVALAAPGQLEERLAVLLADAPARELQGQQGRHWLESQTGAAQRVLALLG